ncbi:hypothetical protein [Kitasatospora cathayae]|uniref:DUF4157 domain-containing protein n=1 Tax=Kitasatospora cathayae TaxID=3004092 RepID=A0ABY7QIW5_9ACTN|nr:hypothetical protein [Kitasatospora sp. HUAS 3-15]WBP92200.1 hypothetical protein O1G21_41060 [Kitasatospora sp. HUAS 3-15]
MMETETTIEIAVTTTAIPSWRTDLVADPVHHHLPRIAGAVEHLAGPLPEVRIVITNRAAGAWLATTAEASAVGGLPLRTRIRAALATWRGARRSAAMATCVLAADHVLVLAFAPALLGGSEDALIETLGHELVHAAQLNRPGRRASRLEDLRANHRLLQRPIADSYRAEAQVCLEEAEAHELEPAILAAVRA